MRADRYWFEQTYDKLLDGDDTGLKQTEMQELFVADYLAQVRTGQVVRPELGLEAEGMYLYRQFCPPMRTARRRQFGKDQEWIQWAIDDPEIAGPFEETCLAMAYPVGDGRDKQLGLWTIEDWLIATTVRQQNVEEAKAALSEFENRQQHITNSMSRKHARTTREAIYGQSW